MSADIDWPITGSAQTMWYTSPDFAEKHEQNVAGGVHLLDAAPAVGSRHVVGFRFDLMEKPGETLWCEYLPPLLCWNGWPPDTLAELLSVALIEARVCDVRKRHPEPTVVNACAMTATVEIVRVVPFGTLETMPRAATSEVVEWSPHSGIAGLLYDAPHLMRLGPYILATGTREIDQGNVAIFFDGREGVELLLTSHHDDAQVSAGRVRMSSSVHSNGRVGLWPVDWQIPAETSPL